MPQSGLPLRRGSGILHIDWQLRELIAAYAALTRISTPVLERHLHNRAHRGKEDIARLPERMGIAAKPRPSGQLIWIHAASVGEAQSALILLDALARKDRHFLVTTGTVTSATLMEKRLPPQAVHQYAPLDAPQWVLQFMDHWKPDAALWMESELWPNTLVEITRRNIPAALVNARLSRRSYQRWRLFPKTGKSLLSAFDLILCQTENDAAFFQNLVAGNENVIVTGNLKYSAAALPVQETDLHALQTAIACRPVWLYASTHEGEEDLACRLHVRLKPSIPSLLTVIVPRHPERRKNIEMLCGKHHLHVCLRSDSHVLPTHETDIYLADTLGELGLFYRLSPLACIGRSFSDDGGGGHNPIEAAQLGCAVLHGPHVQNLAAIYDDMNATGAALRLIDIKDVYKTLLHLLTDPQALEDQRRKAAAYASGHAQILETVIEKLSPMLDRQCA